MTELLQRFGDVAEIFRGSELLRALAYIVASIIAARLVDFILLRVLGRWVVRTDTTVDDEVLDSLHGPVFTTVLVAGLWLTESTLTLSDAVSRVTRGALGTVLIVVWLVSGIRISGLVLQLMSRRKGRLLKPDTLPLFDNLLKVVMIGAAAYFLILAWGRDLTGWLASAGIIGIAVGFAAKDTLANLFAGVFIFADTPYKVGDFIVLDSGERGRVSQIGLRSTRLLTRDDIEITIPNAVIANAKIINESGGPYEKERIRIKVSVAYGTDIDRLREVLMEIAASQHDVCTDPEPRVRFRTFGESSIDFELLGWISEPVLRGRVVDALNCAVYKRLMEEEIEIPYPKRDVYIRSGAAE